MNHHHCVATMARVDRTLMFLNILLLLTVAFLPFPTQARRRVPAEGRRAGRRVRVRRDVRRDGDRLQRLVALREQRPAPDRRERPRHRVCAPISRAFNPGAPAYALIFVVAIVSPLASVALTLALAAFYLPSAAFFER